MYNESMFTRHEMYENSLKEMLQKNLGEALPPQEVSMRVERRARRYQTWLRVKSFFLPRKRHDKHTLEEKLVYGTQE